MNNYKFIDNLIAEQKLQGIDPQDIVWNAGLACVGWPYVFGARGDFCDPANRRARYREDHPTIKTSCKNFDGNGTCSGCKWYPGNVRVRCFDCRGFTYWLLKQVYGWTLQGAGATSQWNTESNWKAKGRIADGVPANTLVCLFYSKDNKEKTWEHTGLGYKGQTLESSVNVQHFDKYNRKWTHWAIPACVGGEIPVPEKPTLRNGDSGEAVKKLQNELIRLGYNVGSKGADGKFGSATEEAVKQFQKDNSLTVDGIVGKTTWEALKKSTPVKPTTKAKVIAKSGSSVRLRRGPSTSADVLGYVKIGTIVDIYEKGDTWCNVYALDQRGYMMTEFLQFGDITEKKYKVVISNLSESDAKSLASKYKDATVSEM